MKQTKRIISLVAIIAILVSASVVPAHAEEYVSRADIFSWIASQGKIGNIISQITGVGCPINEDGRHVAHSCVYDGVAGHYVCTCDSCGDTFVATKSELHDAYDSHVDDMPINGINSNGGFVWYPTISALTPLDDNQAMMIRLFGYAVYPKEQWLTFPCDVSANYWHGVLSDNRNGLGLDAYPNEGMSYLSGYSSGTPSIALDYALSAPVSGVFVRRSSIAVDASLTTENLDNVEVTRSFFSGSTSYTQGEKIKILVSYYSNPTVKKDNYIAAHVKYYFPIFDVQPDSGVISDDTLYLPDTRPGTITGKYLVQNGDVYDDSSTTIINENDNSIYNPVTGDTTTYDFWTYDYSTRTYTMTNNTNNSTTTVTYGDENVTINEGGNTYNIYYGMVNNNGGGSDNQGGGSGSDDSGNSGNSGDTGIIAKLGEMLGTLVSGLLGGVTAFVSAVFDGLISLANVISDKFGQVVSAVLSWFAQIPELFAGFSAFLVAVFPFLPADVMLLLTFGLAAVVFIAIIKAIRR